MSNVMFDPLYGEIEFSAELNQLIHAPIVQRLRHVRLSNIDSVELTGISNISRFEHVIGVARLTAELPFFSTLSQYERLVLQASALLHDWAITAFGHLVEEAYAYAGAKFFHEDKLHELVMGESKEEVGGVERQILAGRETGLRKWAENCVGSKSAVNLLTDITETIRGQGRYGKLIAGSIDIDNIDNVYRVAYHMGIVDDKTIPSQLVRNICRTNGNLGEPVFCDGSHQLILSWLEMREKVYDKLMLAEPDFTSKLMLISSVVAAYKSNEITNSDWNLTDSQLISRLLLSKNRACVETIDRWMVGEYWDSTPLVWMSGNRPTFARMNEFNSEVSRIIGRNIFSYCIKDKRNRELSLMFDNGEKSLVGENSSQWLLGLASPIRKKFTISENENIIKCAETFFSSEFRSYARQDNRLKEDGGEQICLI